MSINDHYVGVVPCAGASTRMGTAKALLDLGGQTFLERVVKALSEGGCRRVFVMLPPSDAGGPEDPSLTLRMAMEASAAGARTITNDDPGEGPITSLRLAIEAAGDAAQGIAYLPVDHPCVGAHDVAGLLAAAVESRAPLTIPMFGEKRGHPAIFDRSLFDELTDTELEGGARTVVHRHLESAHLVQMSDDAVIRDVDTPGEYRALVSAYGAEASG